MGEINQTEADDLLRLEKQKKDNRAYQLPDERGGRLKIELESTNQREEFFLDIHRGRISLEKGTYQTRARQVAILARLDFNGPPHTNPDGQHVGVPHIHLYREGYGDKWAYPLPSEHFPANAQDRLSLLKQFMKFCNIVDPPIFETGLFS